MAKFIDDADRAVYKDGAVEFLRGRPYRRGIALTPEAQARADEIVAAWDAWQAEIERRRQAFHLSELFDADCEAGSAVASALADIRDCRAVSIFDVIAKARSALSDLGNQTLEEALDEAETYPQQIGLSILRDIVDLGGAKAA